AGRPGPDVLPAQSRPAAAPEVPAGVHGRPAARSVRRRPRLDGNGGDDVNVALLALLLASAPAPAPPLADVPFDDAFGLVMFEASIGDSGPLSFLLDTGYETSVLNADAAARLGMKPSDVRAEAAPGGSVEVGTLPPVALAIGALRLDGVRFGTVPLTPLAGFVGRPLDGILGREPLQSRARAHDYAD